MSVREEEQRKNNCPSRGLGLAAAAIGVGVGAALYYFFSKRPENPDVVGSTSEEWSVEQPRAFNDSNASKSYTTISEHSTTDTSINEDEDCDSCNCNGHCSNRVNDSLMTEYSDVTTDRSDSDDSMDSDSNSEESTDESTTSNSIYSSEDTQGPCLLTTIDSMMNGTDVFSDTEMSEWDVTNSSLGVPNSESAVQSPLHRIFSHIASFVGNTDSESCQIPGEDEQTKILREQAFRERSWSLEECSICFEVMLKDQPLLALPCTHNFHVACIGPWLEEQRTCPVCRKAAE